MVLGDLNSLAGAFRGESASYRSLRDKVSPHPADTGDATLNNVLGAVVETLDLLHTQMATSIEDHGDELKAVRDSYSQREIDNHGLFDDLTPDA